MKPASLKHSPLTILASLAGALLVLGLVIDLGLTQPRIRELRSLSQRQTELYDALHRGANREAETRLLRRWLEAEPASDATSGEVAPSVAAEPLTYIDGVVTDSDLTRLELTTAKESRSGELRRTQLVVRVLGDYARILEFVRRIEQGRPLAVIDAFAISATESAPLLEARFSITIYDGERSA